MCISPRARSRADLLKAIDQGFYATELIGSGVNGVTGGQPRCGRILDREGRDRLSGLEITIAGI